jgi:hypothetical protein
MIHSRLSGRYVTTLLTRAGASAATVVAALALATSPSLSGKKTGGPLEGMKKIAYVSPADLKKACDNSQGEYIDHGGSYTCSTDDSEIACDKKKKQCVGCTDGCTGEKPTNMQHLMILIGRGQKLTQPGLLGNGSPLTPRGPAPTGAIAPNSATGTPTPAPTVK